MESVLTKLVSEKLSTYAAIIFMFTYSILLDREFACTCRNQEFDCDFYMALPVFLIFLLILWTDRSFQRVCRYLFSCPFGCCGWCYTCSFLCSFFYHIFKAAFIGLLWAAFVLIDGDWYVCCENDHSEQQAKLACKDKTNITAVEKSLIAELKNQSRVSVYLLFY